MQDATIGKAASAAGVNVETIRFYERKGLIVQPPKGSSYRTYSPATIARVRFIRQAQQIGFSLREVSELLAIKANPDADCAQVRREAVQKIDEVDRKLAELQRIRTALQTVIDSCPGEGDLCACTILDAIQHPAYSRDAHQIASAQPQSDGENIMQTITLTVEGMRCGACAEKIRGLVSAEAGVRGAQVSLGESTVRILYDPELISKDRLAAAIERPGYRVVDVNSLAPVAPAETKNDPSGSTHGRGALR